MKAALIVGIGAPLPLVLLLAAIVGVITFDMAISGIQWILAISPVLLIIDNYRQKRGQNVVAYATLGTGLTSIGAMFMLMGLGLTALATATNGMLWALLVLQSVIYRRPPTEASNTPKV